MTLKPERKLKRAIFARRVGDMTQTLTIQDSYAEERYVASAHFREKTVAKTRLDWEERYRSLMELCPHLVGTIIEGKLASINQSGAHLLGTSQPDQLVGKALTEFIAPDYRDSATERLQRIKTGGIGPVEEKWIKLDGTTIDVEVTAESFWHNDKPAVLLIARDVTERKRVEALLHESESRHRRLTELYLDLIGVESARTSELQNALRRAREVDELKSHLLSIVSHELRTPLTAVRGQTSTLLDYGSEMSRKEQIEALRAIDKEAARLDELISNVLDMSRLESCTLSLEWVAVDVRSILREEIDRIAASAPDHAVSAALPDLPLAQADPRRVRQVVRNLLENAVKFSQPGTTIRVEAEANLAAILVHVHDEGTGIAEEHLPHIFERFYRAERGSIRGSGMGLGLAICKGLVEAMGGRLQVVSQVGQGSTFSFSLPLAPGGIRHAQE